MIKERKEKDSSMFRAICIKRSDRFKKGEIVKAWQGFGSGIHYYKGHRFSLNTPEEKFDEYFVPFKNYYIVEKPPIKRRFRKPKRNFLKVEFKDISDDLLVALYNNVFSYIEAIKQITPELLFTFSYSIVSTLEKLECLYHALPPEQFLEAVEDSEQVFLGIYKTALSIELETLPSFKTHNEMLENFKQENAILKNFYDDLNRK